MKFKFLIIISFFVFILILPICSAAHYIVGIVNNAQDDTSANGYRITLWNPINGLSDNETDIIGPSGNSGTNNVYMIDCEMLNNSCKIGDNLSLQVINNGSNRMTWIVNVTVTGAGYDVVSNLTLSTPLNITYVLVEDIILSPANEIDLTAASNTTVTCEANVTYSSDNTVVSAKAEFFDNIGSRFGDINDSNTHYTNDSCFINLSYASGKAKVLCSFPVAYYANSTQWNCTMNIYDNFSIQKNSSDLTFINSLLAIGLPDIIDYGTVGVNIVSGEILANVTNYGNVRINLSLSGYAFYVGDNKSMNCSGTGLSNVSIGYEKYNLTSSNMGDLTLAQFQNLYINLTANPVIKKFNLNQRQSETENDAINQTYWRIYIPPGTTGSCSGNIVFGAVRSSGS